MIDVDEIKKEVAGRHDYLLGNDDPLLMNVTINELLLRQCVADLNTQHAADLKALVKAIEDGKVKAERIVTQSGNHVSNQVKDAAAKAMREAEERIMEKVVYYLKHMDDMKCAAESHRNISLAATVLSVVCVIGSVWLNVL